MPRKNKRQKVKASPLPAVDLLDTPTPEQIAKGMERGIVVHVETWTASTAHRNRSGILERWFDKREVGFEEGARAAIEWCQERWHARGHIGKLTANYTPTVGTGQSNVARDIEMRDELDEVRAWFHPMHWNVFEDVCRWGHPAGHAAASMGDNPGQCIATAKAIVGLIANTIAMRKGY
jgi:hypothetical protein